MQFPRITIVTPSYNDARYLEYTILSVLDQEYPNLEYIIIDGGSTDGSVDIIKKYESKLAYWISEKDAGMYHAINRGFKMSTGEIMGWINSDDILHRGSLSIIAQIFQDYQNISWIQGYSNIIDESNRIVMTYYWPELTRLYFYKKHRDRNKYIQQESTFWHRRLWEQAGSNVSTKYKLAGDFELWIRFFQYAKLFRIKGLIGSFRVSSSGQASVESFNGYIDETNKILKEFPLSANDRIRVMFLDVIDVLNFRVRYILLFLKRKFGLIDESVSNDAIWFDTINQRFKIDK